MAAKDRSPISAERSISDFIVEGIGGQDDRKHHRATDVQEKAGHVRLPAAAMAGRFRMSGIRRSLQSMMDRATVSTTTIAVAADRPPRNAMKCENLAFCIERERKKVHVVRVCIPKHKAPGHRHGHDKDIDCDQIEREKP